MKAKKKGRKDDLGRALINDMKKKKKKGTNDSILHRAELNDGNETANLNLISVTEEDSLQAFFSEAQLAGKKFQAEKLNAKIVNPKVGVGVLSKEEYAQYEKNKIEKKEFLKIPRRPKWDENTTPKELEAIERESFYEWRRTLAVLEQQEGVVLTPFEKNLEFWRQLWRVVEMSDVVVQILDARNPLLFRCEDLESYVKEDNDKINVLLLNKSDFLTEEQRKIWAKYFDDAGIQIVFFSAKEAALEELKEEENNISEDNTLTETSEDIENFQRLEHKSEDEKLSDNETNDLKNSNVNVNNENENSLEENLEKLNLNFHDKGSNSFKLLGREELINFFRSFYDRRKQVESRDFVRIGLVGYPNVGKSSTINALLAKKKVSVSATPGKTKHFQTHFLTNDVVLCDCPGLVTPSFVSTAAEMILNGILPIDRMRDHVSPTALLGTLIPRNVIEAEYRIMIPRPREGEDPNRPPLAEEILNSFAYCRGFMTQNGQPDNPRASRYILKDFVNGRLLYCVAPPGISQEDFHRFPKKDIKLPTLTPQAARAVNVAGISSERFDEIFFNKNPSGVHQKGVDKVKSAEINSNLAPDGSKPWKNHKEKRNKKEKLRRIYGYLDK